MELQNRRLENGRRSFIRRIEQNKEDDDEGFWFWGGALYQRSACFLPSGCTFFWRDSRRWLGGFLFYLF